MILRWFENREIKIFKLKIFQNRFSFEQSWSWQFEKKLTLLFKVQWMNQNKKSSFSKFSSWKELAEENLSFSLALFLGIQRVILNDYIFNLMKLQKGNSIQRTMYLVESEQVRLAFGPSSISSEKKKWKERNSKFFKPPLFILPCFTIIKKKL